MIRSVEELILRLYDKEQGQEYEAEAYKLENGITVSYDYRSGTWQDPEGREYDPVTDGGAITGFIMAK
jgi:hypothetical protein